MKKAFLTLALSLFVFGVVAVAQDTKEATHTVNMVINTQALVDVESTGGTTSIDLQPTAPEETGLGLNFDNISKSTLLLNYSSIVTRGNKNSISASIDSDLPEGIEIALQVSDAAAGGKGKNSSNNAQVLTKNSVEVIKDIESCYTGNGHSNGHNLTYTMQMDDSKYEKIVADSYSATITYTITEN